MSTTQSDIGTPIAIRFMADNPGRLRSAVIGDAGAVGHIEGAPEGGPQRPDANVCWCLSYRLTSSRENRELVGPARGERVRQLVQQAPPPGVLAYENGDVVGWAAVHPRADTSFARNRKIPHVDDLDVWSVWCIRVRPGHRKTGISHHLLAGAVAFARDNGAVAIEGYPLDNNSANRSAPPGAG